MPRICLAVALAIVTAACGSKGPAPAAPAAPAASAEESPPAAAAGRVGRSYDPWDDQEASRIEVAGAGVRKLLYESYPMWIMRPANSGRCPALDELTDVAGPENLVDPWDHPYLVICEPSSAPLGFDIAVRSLGPDGRDGTADDIGVSFSAP